MIILGKIMAQVDGGDYKFDEFCDDMLYYLNNRIMMLHIREFADTHHILTQEAKYKLLLIAAIQQMPPSDDEKTISKLVNDIGLLMPEMYEKGWMKGRYTPPRPQEDQQLTANSDVLPQAADVEVPMIIPEEAISRERYFILDWKLAEGDRVKAGETICTLNDSSGDKAVNLDFDSVLVEVICKDGDLVGPGDKIGVLKLIR